MNITKFLTKWNPNADAVISSREVTKKTAEEFKKDLNSLGMGRADGYSTIAPSWVGRGDVRFSLRSYAVRMMTETAYDRVFEPRP